MIEERANPNPELPGSTSNVWWCTDCNRLIQVSRGFDKPDVCPLWACVERRKGTSNMPTIWDELRRLIGEAEQCLRAEEQRYADLKAQHRELQTQHSELLNVATLAITQPCHPDCACRNCRLIAVVAKSKPDFVLSFNDKEP